MRYYDVTNTENSLVHEAWDLCDADITKYPLANITRRFNSSLEELIGELISADGTFQWDDTNWTDQPVGTGTLVQAQASYAFSSEYLEIDEIDVKDLNGIWRKLIPVDPSEIPDDQTMEEYFGTTAGMPTHYDKTGDTVTLYPAPSSTAVTLASGLRIRFKRTADLFTVSDTTQEPGLPSPYHTILCYMAAIPYCMKYKPERVALYEKKKDDMKKALMKFMGRRQKDTRKRATMSGINFK